MPRSVLLSSRTNHPARGPALIRAYAVAPRVEPLLDITYYSDPRVARIKTIIRSRMQSKLALPDLAAESGLSVSRLCHLFKGQTDIALGRYLKQFRMECARNLLESTFLSVKEISARVGLNDVSHFVRDFEEAYGLSPSRHRLEFSSRTSQFKSSLLLVPSTYP